MAVHRVGRTLLLDELDIQELFMNSSKVSTVITYLLLVVEMVSCVIILVDMPFVLYRRVIGHGLKSFISG